MEMIKPVKIKTTRLVTGEKLTSAEMGKLWATYVGNSMSSHIMSYFRQHVADEEIKALLEKALSLSAEFMKTTEHIFNGESFPIPKGFSDEDVNLGAPRLFEDEYYVHYLKYAAKAGMSIYNVAIPLVFRKDVRDFFIYCMDCTIALIVQSNDILMKRGYILKPPLIPVPEKVEFVRHDFLNGFIGHVRPLHALEIAHLYDNIESNATSKALILSFSQVAKSEKIRKLFIEGKQLTHKHIEQYMEKLHNENLPSPSFLDHLVTTSTFAPFSDKLMLFHKMDMFSMKIRAFGNSAAVNGRHDLGLLYAKSLAKISTFVEDAAKLMIENGWMEQPPFAANRDRLSSE